MFRGLTSRVQYSIYDQTCSAGVGYLSVPVVFRKAPPHHVGHAEGFHSQQVEDHGVGESELGLEDGRFTLSHTKRMKSVKEKSRTACSHYRHFVFWQQCLHLLFSHLLFSAFL